MFGTSKWYNGSDQHSDRGKKDSWFKDSEFEDEGSPVSPSICYKNLE